jgi:hypothetical protein
MPAAECPRGLSCHGEKTSVTIRHRSRHRAAAAIIICRMVSKPRLCDIFETDLLAGWIWISCATVVICEPDFARTRRL